MRLTTTQRAELQRDSEDCDEALLILRFSGGQGLSRGDLGTLCRYVETRKRITEAKLKNRSTGRLQDKLAALRPVALDAFRNACMSTSRAVAMAVLNAVGGLCPELLIAIEGPKVEDPFVAAFRKEKPAIEDTGAIEDEKKKTRLELAISSSVNRKSPPLPTDLPTIIEQEGSDNRVRVDAFIARMGACGVKVNRKNIWTVAGYTDRTELVRFQSGDRCTPSATSNFNRVLSMTPEDFASVLQRKSSAK